MATMNTQPMPADRRAGAVPPAAVMTAARVPDATSRATTAADEALADLFPALRLRNAATPSRTSGGR